MVTQTITAVWNEGPRRRGDNRRVLNYLRIPFKISPLYRDKLTCTTVAVKFGLSPQAILKSRGRWRSDSIVPCDEPQKMRFVPSPPELEKVGHMSTANTRQIDPREAEQLFPILIRAGSRFTYEAGDRICSQGDACNGVHYIHNGLVKISTVSRRGRAAILGFLWPGEFFGESCLAGRARRQFSAEALTRTSVIFIKTRTMKRLIAEEPTVAAHFVKHLLERNRHIEEDLLGHIFDSSEQRLARTLLWLSHHGQHGKTPSILETIDQDTLAAIVGTTRPRVNFFMNKFRKMGWIHYAEGPGVTVNPSLEAFLQKESSEVS